MSSHISQYVFDRTEFLHFVAGDGQFYYDSDDDTLSSKSVLDCWLKSELGWDGKSRNEADKILLEMGVYRKYADLKKSFEEDGDAIDYIIVGEIVVLAIVVNY